ncbi:gp53-like domain-containing protein [Photorhabdus australis]|uniref:gp53-like domain-containing protein n=1 Tax=Photorhabdus australis TaxID=286156 RepID=UPI0008163344|nr:hypothetical protein [Photorhabdus australis]
MELAKSAFPKAGGIVNGNVDATGSIYSVGMYDTGVRVYSATNKPSPGELGAYTTGECDGRFQLKGSGLLSIDSDNARFNGHVLAWLDEVDRNYQPRGNYQPAGNYAPMGQSYTKTESDSRYGSKNTALKSTNGWWRCGDTGMIYQWGVTRVLNPEEVIIVQLPIRFSNVCLGVMLTVNRLGSGSGVANGYVADLNTSSFKLTNDYAVSGISVGYYWFAVGY